MSEQTEQHLRDVYPAQLARLLNTMTAVEIVMEDIEKDGMVDVADSRAREVFRNYILAAMSFGLEVVSPALKLMSATTDEETARGTFDVWIGDVKRAAGIVTAEERVDMVTRMVDALIREAKNGD